MVNLLKMMHIDDATMRVENGKIRIDEPYAQKTDLNIFSAKIDDAIAKLDPYDSGVPFTAAVFVAETGSWYPLFKVNSAVMERIADYVDSNSEEGMEDFVERQMTRAEFNDIDGDFMVHIISLDDGIAPLVLDRDSNGSWTLNNAEFELDMEDAPGLQRMVKKILSAPAVSFYDD